MQPHRRLGLRLFLATLRGRVVPALAISAVILPGPPAAAVEIFLDAFESGTFCAWSFPPTGFEVAANGLDDDCDGETDEAAASCDNGLPSNSSDPLQYAAALNLCQTTTEAGHDWGIISGSFSLASGTGTPAAVSRAIRPDFGSGTSPRDGIAMAVLSTGAAAALGQVNPGYSAFQIGLETGTQSPAPADWLAAHGGTLPTAPGCPDALGPTAVNPVMLTYRIRVPGNARSFRLDANFLGADFPEWVCTSYTDFFVVLLDSQFAGEPANPADKNLAIHLAPGGTYPVGVNLAVDDTGLFTQCQNGTIGCAGTNNGTTSACTSTAGLVGTGMDISNPPSLPGTPPWCDAASTFTGGGTGWLVIRGNAVPGENLTLRLAIWDTGDGNYDSVVLLDNFQWSTAPTTPGATSN